MFPNTNLFSNWCKEIEEGHYEDRGKRDTRWISAVLRQCEASKDGAIFAAMTHSRRIAFVLLWSLGAGRKEIAMIHSEAFAVLFRVGF